MTIEKNKVVSVSYALTARKGLSLEETQVEKTDSANPFTFLFGVGKLLPDFEKNLSGKKAGDKFDFFITASNGYGIRNEKYVMNIPIDSFKDESGTLNLNEIRVGNTLHMNDNHGNQLQGEVKEVTAAHVKMDFNHPLADHELHFKGEVLNVRPATAEEISHGHVHGPGGHHH
ncbi:MAG: FKBP-type peptidyl-prolyl cis-trans isomerase [Bacteroidetes bacterium]|nr:FKBP-type peptidyl-prolyl cis-trans isomerase [Bacteroidota bacterium]